MGAQEPGYSEEIGNLLVGAGVMGDIQPMLGILPEVERRGRNIMAPPFFPPTSSPTVLSID